VRLADALGNSLNTATVRLVEFLGLESAYRFLTTAGITLDHPVSYYGFGLSVGVMDVRFSDMVRAYALLLDNPVYEPSLFLSHELIPLKPLAVSTVDRYLLEQTLLAPLNRRSAFGLSSVLDTSVPQAVKTGTSTDFRDNWTFSYSDDLVMGVWVGNNDNSSME
jgi:penicillin-binding protein 1C